jgi:hypothetical protein
MTIIKLGVPSIIPDNDMQYMTYINRVIHSEDASAQVTIIRGIRAYSYSITPSEPKCKEALIESLKLAHKILGVPIQFSKTITMSPTIYFELI